MILVNLTPHTIRLFRSPGAEKPYFMIPPSGTVLRLIEEDVESEPIEAENGILIPAVERVQHWPDLPPRRRGTLYIVSYPLLEVLQDERDDLVAPDTNEGSVVRRGERVVGVCRFVVGEGGIG